MTQKLSCFNLYLYLLALLLMLSGCTCGCVFNVSDLQNGYETSKALLTVYADGCGPIDGSVDSNGVGPLYCGIPGSTGYANQGHWVQVPNISVKQSSYLTIDITGSIYYCSTGFDIKNPSPQFLVYPAKTVSHAFADGSMMALTPGQSIIIEDSGPGAIIGTNSNAPACSTIAGDAYQSFALGNCKGTKALGLSIYVDNQELTTLNSTQPSNFSSTSANLFAYVTPSDLNGYTDTSGIYHRGVIQQYNNLYQSALSTDWGAGKYMFIVPNTMSGNLGFALAQGSGSEQNKGYGNYSLSVLTTPPACYVMAAQAQGQPAERGALQMYIGNSNPNQIQEIANDFNNLAPNEISIYYPQLLNYIAQTSGVAINNNASILGNLVVQVAPEISPVVIDTNSISVTPYADGYIWFLVRDDYYYDNVGNYIINVTVTNKTNSEVSAFINSLVAPITTELAQYSQALYNNFYNNTSYLSIIRATLMLYLVLLGCQYALGLHQISSTDLIIRAIKIGAIVELLDPQSWNFFNTYLFSLFTTGNEFIIAAATGDTSVDKVNIFGFIDDAFFIFFQSTTWIKLSALLFDLVGFICIPILLYVIISYLFIMARVIISYLVCVAAISILLSIAPLFIILILFERTKKYFDGWISSLADFAFQSVILFTAFYFVSQIFVELWLSVMSYDACWGGAVEIWLDLNLLTGNSTNFLPKISLGCAQWFRLKHYSDVYYLLIQCLSLVILVGAIRGIVSHVAEMTSSLTGVSGGATGVQAVGDAIEHDVRRMTINTAEGIKYIAIVGGSGNAAEKDDQFQQKDMKQRDDTRPRAAPTKETRRGKNG